MSSLARCNRQVQSDLKKIHQSRPGKHLDVDFLEKCTSTSCGSWCDFELFLSAVLVSGEALRLNLKVSSQEK